MTERSQYRTCEALEKEGWRLFRSYPYWVVYWLPSDKRAGRTEDQYMTVWGNGRSNKGCYQP